MQGKAIMTVYKNKEPELAATYKPVFMMDKNEPFEISAIGYTFFEQTQRSDSFPNRYIVVNKDCVSFVIEYAIWFDYDIEHLYELEHVWIYVDPDGTIQQAEGSFHGKYINIVSLDTGEIPVTDRTHLVVYLQPGKHAVLPDARMVPVIPGWRECCSNTAGQAGVLIQDMFKEQISADNQDQKMVRAYIHEKYAFEPAMKFELFSLDNSLLIPWKQLKTSIPVRIHKQMERIKNYYNQEIR